ncbi:MAG: ABC transporter permease subunit [Bacilli bacterium]|nr:ABC transporter permease subunit [Bacilli bacterium]
MFLYLILIVISFIFLFPCLWIVLSSFSKTGSLYDFDGFFPTAYSLDSYVRLFADTALYDYPKWLLNTLFVAIMNCILSTILIIGTAYVMSYFQFKARKPLMKLTLILSMFPSFMGMSAVYILMTQFKFVNSLWGLVIIYSCTAPLGYLVQKGFFDTIPHSIYEAAKMDGASNFRIFRTITLPLAKPIIVYTALTSFAWPWSDFVLPKLLLIENDKWTVAVGLLQLGQSEFSRFAAGSVFIAVPIVLLYLLLVKNMVTGMTSGAVKG